MNTAPNLNKTTVIAATDRTKAAATPRIKLLSHGFSIDHPDPELGEQLMADALGVTDREAMHGILTQLVKSSVNGQKPDEVNLSFMISMVKSIRPRDSGKAIVGNVTQHASVIVSDKLPAGVVTDARMAPMLDPGTPKHDKVEARRKA